MIKETTHTIKLLNKSHTMKCPEAEVANLDKASEKLNDVWRQQKKKFKQLDEHQLLLMTALHISHELITAQQKQIEHQLQVTEFISSLENKIQHVVGGQSEIMSTLMTEDIV